MKLLTLSYSKSSNLIIPTPSGLKLEPYQKAGVEYLIDSPGHVFCNDQAGLGKTIEFISYINYANPRRTLITCPPQLVGVWTDELDTWLIDKDKKVKVFHPSENFADADILILSYYWLTDGAGEIVPFIVNKFKYELLNADEYQAFRNPKSSKSKNMLNKNGFADWCDKFVPLSGSPFTNRPIEAKRILHKVAPNIIPQMSDFEFGQQFCRAYKTKAGFWDYSGVDYAALKVLNRELRSQCMFRRLKKNVLPQLPGRRKPRVIYLDENKRARAIIKKMDVFDENLVVKNPTSPEFDNLSTLRKELGLIKVKAVVDYVKQQLESGYEKIVVFCHHSEVAKQIAAALDRYGVSLAVGGMAARIPALCKVFNRDPALRVFCASIGVCAYGLTITSAAYGIFAEIAYTWTEIDQCIDRMDRYGQLKSVMSDFLMWGDSFDLRMLNILLPKEKLSKVFD